MRAVYYSLVVPSSGLSKQREWQLRTSTYSLRSHNSSVPVYLFWYGDLLDPLVEDLRQLDVRIVHQRSYAQCLRESRAPCWQALRWYAPLSKWLALDYFVDDHWAQILCLDCDTFFWRDVDFVFKRYKKEDVYAREEVYTHASHLAYDGRHVDEKGLRDLCANLNLHFIPPFNTGVVLFNNGSWRKLIEQRLHLLSSLCRLLKSIHVDKRLSEVLGRGAFDKAVQASLQHVEELKYPSKNPWIVEEVCMWLVSGAIDGLTVGRFAAKDCLQGGEFLKHRATDCQAILCHYFSRLTEYFYLWYEGELRLSSSS